MKFLIKTAIILILSHSFLAAQVIEQISGFDITVNNDKSIYDIQRLDDTTALLLFSKHKMLWRSDGTKAGTFLLHNWDTENTSQDPFNCTVVGVVNGKAVMLVSTDTEGRELWVSDGTIAGTHILLDYFPGTKGLDNYKSETKKFVVVDNNCYLISKDVDKWNIMKTDGTVAGTGIFVEDLVDSVFSNIDTPNLFLLGNDFYFMLFDNIYRIDKDTKAVSVIPSPPFFIMDDMEIITDSTLLIAADDNGYGAVCNLNLNSNQIIILKDYDHSFYFDKGNYFYKIFTKFNGKFYFSQGFDDYTIYATDGTLSGTKLVAQVPTRSKVFLEYGQKLWFTNLDNESYLSVYTFDKNNKLTKEITSSILNNYDKGVFSLLDNNKFFISAAFDQTGDDWEPHLYNPSNKKLTKIADLNTSDSYPKLITKLKDNSYLFYAYNNEAGDFNGTLYSLKFFPVSTEELEKESQLKAIPNVTNQSWNIIYRDLLTNVPYRLADIQGNIVKTGIMDNESTVIDARDLAAGFYILMVGLDSGVESVKLVKQ